MVFTDVVKFIEAVTLTEAVKFTEAMFFIAMVLPAGFACISHSFPGNEMTPGSACAQQSRRPWAREGSMESRQGKRGGS